MNITLAGIYSVATRCKSIRFLLLGTCADCRECYFGCVHVTSRPDPGPPAPLLAPSPMPISLLEGDLYCNSRQSYLDSCTANLCILSQTFREVLFVHSDPTRGTSGPYRGKMARTVCVVFVDQSSIWVAAQFFSNGNFH